MIDIPNITIEQVFGFASAVVVPAIVDIIRVGTFQLSLRFNLSWLTDITNSKRFALLVTLFSSLLVSVFIGSWFGLFELTIDSLRDNTLVIFGLSQIIYKGIGYESSEVRKTLTRMLDKLNPEHEQIDKEEMSKNVG